MIPAADFFAQAACAGVEDPEIFHPANGAHPSREAMAYCISCPVREACGEYAERHGLSGLWGGKSESHRQGRSNRDLTVCRNGHPRTPENTKIGSTGRKRCRECITEGSRRAYAVRKLKANVA